MKYDTATPYIASYVILRKQGKAAFVMRSNTSWMNNHYGLPSGKVEKGERYLAAAVREAKEEVGVDVEENDLRHVLTVHRIKTAEPDGADNWVDVYFEAETYKGEPYNAEPDIHSSLEWLDPANLPDNVIPAVRQAMEDIALGKTYSEYTL